MIVANRMAPPAIVKGRGGMFGCWTILCPWEGDNVNCTKKGKCPSKTKSGGCANQLSECEWKKAVGDRLQSVNQSKIKI